jgi:hypothetical protein
MFAWEDPVAVDIQTAGDGVIEGGGCCAGLFDPAFQCCGVLNGQIVDRHASFGFSFSFAGEVYEYSTDAFVSADGQRMAGTFSRTVSPVAWVRIGSADRYLAPAPQALQEILGTRVGQYALALSDAPAAGSDFSAQRTYRLNVGHEFVSGEVGAFWAGEISWSADEQTLAAGPVPETAPGLPVALRLRFDGTALASVEAVMASGLRYQFQATASP